jgi:hypothetical protein
MRGFVRWAQAICLAIVGLTAFALTPAALAAANDPTPAQAIAQLNTWRGQAGEQPVSTTAVSAWNTGCQDHNQYEEDNNNTLGHFETMGNPGYTADGAVAGPDSVLAEYYSTGGPVPEPDLLPQPVWDGAVFHRSALLEPRLANVGFNSTTFDESGTYYSFVCLWDQNGVDNPPFGGAPPAIDNSRTTPGLTLYPSPENGEVNVPTTFPGFESPDPTQETGVPNGATLGWLINVEINGPWPTTNGGYSVWAHGVTATIEPDGTNHTVPHVVSECGTAHCAVGSGSPPTCDTSTGGTKWGCYFEGGFAIFPTQPLTPNTMYHVIATGTVTDATNPGSPIIYPFTKTWCFSTGPTFTPSADCTGSGTGASAHTLTVSKAGSGSGLVTSTDNAIDCGSNCSHSYTDGSNVTLSAVAGAGSKFTGWSGGGCSGTGTCSVTITTATTVTATFTKGSGPTPGKPTVSGPALTGVAHNQAKLGFTVKAGANAPALKQLTLTAPKGVTFVSKDLRKRLTIGGHLPFKPSLAHGALEVALNAAATRVTVTITHPAIAISKSLQRTLKHKTVTLTFVVRVTDALGKSTSVAIAFKVR